MLTLYDYLPSQNGWKIRQLLQHLQRPYRTRIVSIFEGEGRRDDYHRINPTGAVPAIELEDGRALAESNAILDYLAQGSPYLPGDAFAQAKVRQWLSFEQQYVEPVIGSLRYWTLTGKLPQRHPALIDAKRGAALRALKILESEFALRPFAAGEDYTIADIALYAYASRAEDAGIELAPYPQFRAWVDRVQSQPGHLAQRYPYEIDPHSSKEL
ncbi:MULTISPECIES: glutathione S-transferase family protein [unclassified Lysobacter]|uniref:glutathione S-transferase family protein n=1 Tax=unclassified Lysobacter TaxID=2635362 RepID=UPI00070080E9|nr:MULTISPECIES: glutathione S-transferase family protein [unclassified Lysobacter]KRC34599.1 glutathione S-transferase [Lysobacter sp. Root76]KRD65905.1 glutathione S-transferase [Lysobacter sp. Root96]